MMYSKIQLTLQKDNTWKYEQQEIHHDRVKKSVVYSGLPGCVFAYVPRGTEDHHKDILISKALRLGKRNIKSLEKSVKNLEKMKNS